MTLPDLFTRASLTAAIMALPKVPTLLGDKGYFKIKRVKNNFAVVESINGRLVLVENTDRRGDAGQKGNQKRKRRVFEIPHLPKGCSILPDELNVTAFGDDGDNTKAVAAVVNDKLQACKDDIEATKEYHRMGAISGKILDADGKTVIYDLYREFAVNEKTINLAFSTASTDVRGVLTQAKRYAKKQLGGSIIKKWECYCSATWFDDFVAHANVQKAYLGYQEASDRIGGDVSAGFKFADIEFIVVDEEVIGTDGSNVEFIPADTARLVPIADDLFQTILGPANYNDAVNTQGQEMYAAAEERSMGKGWDVEAQSNPLSICTAPGALIKLTKT